MRTRVPRIRPKFQDSLRSRLVHQNTVHENISPSVALPLPGRLRTFRCDFLLGEEKRANHEEDVADSSTWLELYISYSANMCKPRSSGRFARRKESYVSRLFNAMSFARVQREFAPSAFAPSSVS